jgi:hypothetical protein
VDDSVQDSINPPSFHPPPLFLVPARWAKTEAGAQELSKAAEEVGYAIAEEFNAVRGATNWAANVFQVSEWCNIDTSHPPTNYTSLKKKLFSPSFMRQCLTCVLGMPKKQFGKFMTGKSLIVIVFCFVECRTKPLRIVVNNVYFFLFSKSGRLETRNGSMHHPVHNEMWRYRQETGFIERMGQHGRRGVANKSKNFRYRSNCKN